MLGERQASFGHRGGDVAWRSPNTDLFDALGELRGVTITVRHPLNDGAQRLMCTLGVTVVIDPAAAPCSQFLQPSHGRPWRVSDRMCPDCAALER